MLMGFRLFYWKSKLVFFLSFIYGVITRVRPQAGTCRCRVLCCLVATRLGFM